MKRSSSSGRALPVLPAGLAADAARLPPPDAAAPRVGLLTLGCDKNTVDSERILARLRAAGAAVTTRPEEADVVVVNTCGFIDMAKQESIDTILEAVRLKEEGRVRAVVAMGCLVQRYKHELEAELPEVDLFLGLMETDRLLPELRSRNLVPATEDVPLMERSLRILSSDTPHTAPLKISEGCDHGCAFCAIPLMRGKFRSTPVNVLVREARELEAAGVVELSVVSQDTTWYGRDYRRPALHPDEENRLATPHPDGESAAAPGRPGGTGRKGEGAGQGSGIVDHPSSLDDADYFYGKPFPGMAGLDLSIVDRRSSIGGAVQGEEGPVRGEMVVGRRGALPHLLRTLLAETTIPWLRLFYMYPSGITRELVELMAREPRLLPYLDMPVQHGSDRMLRRMRRPERRRTILERVAWLRGAVPDVVLRTTVIVGFPGERDEDFEALIDLLEEVRFDHLGAFAYSEEEGTSAATMDGVVPPALRQERLERLMDVQRAISQEKNEARVGREVQVLIDAAAATGATGRAWWQAPEVDGVVHLPGADVTPGRFVTVRLTSALDRDFEGLLIREDMDG
ncbi:MAG: radical SAM protein [Gemmatimonadota bacterium]